MLEILMVGSTKTFETDSQSWSHRTYPSLGVRSKNFTNVISMSKIYSQNTLEDIAGKAEQLTLLNL